MSINNVVTAIVCHPDRDDDSVHDNDDPFQRFGVTEEGLVLSDDADNSSMQIVLRYQKLIVTNDSLRLHAGACVSTSA